MTEFPSNTPSNEPKPGKRGLFTRFLDGVEWLGNLLPHPVTLFAILALGIVLLSGLLGWMGLAVEDPRPAGARGVAEDGMIRAVSLLNGDGLRRIFVNLVDNFTNFAPLGVVLVAMIGVGVAEKSGLLSAAVRAMVMGAPKHLVTVAIVFAGIVSNTASEVGYVVLIPLAAAIFYALGRHPLAGMAAAFAGVSGGYSANLLIGTIDPLLAGITQEAAQLIDPDYTVAATANWYFMFVGRSQRSKQSRPHEQSIFRRLRRLDFDFFPSARLYIWPRHRHNENGPRHYRWNERRAILAGSLYCISFLRGTVCGFFWMD